MAALAASLHGVYHFIIVWKKYLNSLENQENSGNFICKHPERCVFHPSFAEACNSGSAVNVQWSCYDICSWLYPTIL